MNSNKLLKKLDVTHLIFTSPTKRLFFNDKLYLFVPNHKVETPAVKEEEEKKKAKKEKKPKAEKKEDKPAATEATTTTKTEEVKKQDEPAVDPVVAAKEALLKRA